MAYRDIAFAVGGLAVGGIAGYFLREVLIPKGLPDDLQSILNGFSVEVILWEGTPQERHVYIPEVNPAHPEVRVLNYVASSSWINEATGETGDYRDTYVLGVEDYGLESKYWDDWKDFIVSIRRVYHAGVYDEDWVTFQISYSHVIVRDKAGKVVYDTKTIGPTTPLLVIVFRKPGVAMRVLPPGYVYMR
jgi:hypothetical protein